MDALIDVHVPILGSVAKWEARLTPIEREIALQIESNRRSSIYFYDYRCLFIHTLASNIKRNLHYNRFFSKRSSHQPPSESIST